MSGTDERADSPPSRRQTSRWQKLRTLAVGHACPDQADSLLEHPSSLPHKQQQHGSGISTTDVSDAADVLKRCVAAVHANSHEEAQGNSTDAQIKQQQQPGGSSWAEQGLDSASSALLALLQSDLTSTSALPTKQQDGALDSEPQHQDMRAAIEPSSHVQHQLDRAGVFDYLKAQQQQQQQQQQISSAKRNKSSTASLNRQPAGSRKAGVVQSTSTGVATQSSTTAGGRRPLGSATHASSKAQTPAPQQRSAGSMHATQQRLQVLPAQQQRQQKQQQQASSPAQNASAAAAIRPPRPSSKAATAQQAASSCGAPGTTKPRLPPATATAAANKGDTPQLEVSTVSTSSTGSMRSVRAELQLELAAVLLYRLLRRWRLAAADQALDRARARPMNSLLSKRKAMRAWKLTVSSRGCEQQEQEQQQQWQLQGPKQQSEPGQQPSTGSPAVQLQQAGPAPQAASQPVPQSSSKHMQVACQFHKLYRLHCCLQHWHAWAVTAADARRQEQAQQQLQERQRLLVQEQEEVLAEFERLQQQELQQLQAAKQLEVAACFHRLYSMHIALRTWYKHASISGALKKLHPTVRHTQGMMPPASTAAAGGGGGGPAGAAGTDSCSGSDSAPGAGNSKPVDSQGLLDLDAVQRKAQRLLQHLASASAAKDSVPQPQTQDPQQPHEQQPQKAKQQKQAQQLPNGHPRPKEAACGPAAAGPSSSGQAGQLQHAAQQQPAPQVPATAQPEQQVLPAAAATGPAVAQPPSIDALDTEAHEAQMQEQTEASCQQQEAECGTEQQQQEQQPQQLEQQKQDTGLAEHDCDLAPEHSAHLADEGQYTARVTCATAAVPASASVRHSSPHKLIQQPPRQGQGQEEASDTQAADPQQQWLAERQAMQQRLRLLQAEEQRRLRQYQQVEQQLQAVLAAQQEQLAGVHAARALLRRSGLQPWLGLGRLRAQQWQLAVRQRHWHLLSSAMAGLRHGLVCRHKRHTCQHIQAWGKLAALRRQRQQQVVLTTLSNWALIGQHYRARLAARCLTGWRMCASEGRETAAAAAAALRALRQRQVLGAWWRQVQDEAHEQLLVELELSAKAASWRAHRLQACMLHDWRSATAAAGLQHQQEAAHQKTLNRVKGWLAELEGKSSSKAVGSTAATARAQSVGVAPVGVQRDVAAATALGATAAAATLSGPLTASAEWQVAFQQAEAAVAQSAAAAAAGRQGHSLQCATEVDWGLWDLAAEDSPKHADDGEAAGCEAGVGSAYSLEWEGYCETAGEDGFLAQSEQWL